MKAFRLLWGHHKSAQGIFWWFFGCQPNAGGGTCPQSRTGHLSLAMSAKSPLSSWESAQGHKEMGSEEQSSISAKNFDHWKGFGSSCVDVPVLLSFVVQETKIKVWSMHSPTSEAELKSCRSMKYTFAINNSHEYFFLPDARDPTLSYFCHAIKILQGRRMM